MRIIAFSDLQLERFREFSGVNELGFNRRAYDMISRIDSLIVKEFDKDGLDAVVIAGDIFNNKELIEVDTTHLIHMFVRKWRMGGIRVIILVGNHDLFRRDGSITSLSQFEGYCEVIRKAQVLEIAGVNVAFSPFRETDAMIEEDLNSLNVERFEEKPTNILFGHWTVKGASTGDFTLDEGIDPEFPALKSYDRVYLGDIHKTQRLGANILYLGSPAQLNFGERGHDKFIWLITEKGEEGLPTRLPQFVVETDPENAKKLQAAGHYVRFDAKSRESANAAALIDGIRIEHNWFETVAKDSAKMVTTISDAVTLYAEQQARQDLLEAGQSYVKDLLRKQSIPSNAVILRSVVATEFFSYPTLELKLDDKRGLIMLHGVVSSTAEYDSNGAGKTTLFETVLYALYGVTLRFKNVTSSIVRKAQKAASVVLKFSIGDRDYVIERGTELGLNFKQVISGVDHSLTNTSMALTQKAINDLVGDREYFQRLTLMALHAQPSFLSLGDGDKKDFIDTFTGLKVFDEAKSLVERLKETTTLSLSRVTQSESATNSTITANQVSLARLEKALADFETNEDVKDAARLLEIEGLKKERDALRIIEQPDIKETALTKAIVAKKSDIADLEEASDETEKDRITKLAPLLSKKAEIEASLSEAVDTLKSCPTCHRAFDSHTDNSSVRKHLQSELDKIQPQMDAINKELHPLINEAETKIKLFQKELEALEAGREKEIEQANSVKVSNTKTQGEIARYNRDIARLETVKRSTSDHLSTEIKQLSASIASSQQALITYNTERQSLNDTLGKQDFWIKGFSNNGCKSLLYTSVIDRLNQFLQQNCNALSGGVFTMRLLPFTENKSSKTENSRISVEVLNSNGCDAMAGDSLGEKARIDIAVNLALRSVLQESTGLSFNLFFADEPWLGLDDSGKLAAYKLFQSESQKVDNFIVTDQSPFTKGSQDCLSWTARKSIVNGLPFSVLSMS